MSNWIVKLLDRIFAVLGALLFSQIPLFIIYYIQQLQGHVSELQVQVDAIRRLASQNGKSLEHYIQKFLSSSDLDFHGQGLLMQKMVERLEAFSKALFSLQQASIWERPVIFVKNLDWSIFQATLDHYEVGLPITLEGAFYALLGIFIGFLIFYLIKMCGNALFFMRKNPFPFK